MMLKTKVNNIHITVYENNGQAMYRIEVGIPYDCKFCELLFSKDDQKLLMSRQKRQKIVNNWSSFDLKEDHGYVRLLQCPRKDISNCFDLFPEQIQHILDEYFE